MAEKPTREPRKSLTRSQLETPEALDLLALLQTVTEDGRLLDEEISALKEWLDENSESQLPAVAHLRGAVETVLEDGRVSEEERVWLQQAIETVLPREDRSLAAMRRREAKADDRAAAAEEKAEAREMARKSRPVTRFDFMVAGVMHEGRGAIVQKECGVDTPVFLVREPSNRYSPNAVLVRLPSGRDVGYVPEADAARLAPMLDQGALQSASVKKVLRGGKVPTPVVWGELFAADAPVGHAVGPTGVPAQLSRRSGCVSGVVLAAAAVLLRVWTGSS